MRNRKRALVAGLLSITLFAVSGCHSSPSGYYKVRWVSEADSTKTLELSLQNPTVLGRVHMAVLGARIRGTYVLKDGDKSVKGKVTQLEDAYRLVPDDGKEQTLTVERQSGSLKDQSGGIWKFEKPTTTATLKEW